MKVKQLTTSDFNKLTKHVHNFIGAVPCDTQTPLPNGSYSIVMNTDNHTKPGTHWVALHVQPKTLIFWDTFSRKPDNLTFPPDFRKTIRRLGRKRKLISNSKLIQALDSNTCGFHCCYLLDQLALNKSIKDILKVYGTNLTKNDQFAVRYFKKNFDVDK